MTLKSRKERSNPAHNMSVRTPGLMMGDLLLVQQTTIQVANSVSTSYHETP